MKFCELITAIKGLLNSKQNNYAYIEKQSEAQWHVVAPCAAKLWQTRNKGPKKYINWKHLY